MRLRCDKVDEDITVGRGLPSCVMIASHAANDGGAAVDDGDVPNDHLSAVPEHRVGDLAHIDHGVFPTGPQEQVNGVQPPTKEVEQREAVIHHHHDIAGFGKPVGTAKPPVKGRCADFVDNARFQVHDLSLTSFDPKLPMVVSVDRARAGKQNNVTREGNNRQLIWLAQTPPAVNVVLIDVPVPNRMPVILIV